MPDSLSPERKKHLDQLLKLLALANNKGAFAAEAATARAKADELMRRHNLSLAEGSKDREQIEIHTHSPWAKGAQWEFDIANALANLCGCKAYFHGDFREFDIAGTVSNLEAFRYMLAAINIERIGAWRTYKYQKAGKDGLWAFSYAYGQALETRIATLLRNAAGIIAETRKAELWFESTHTIARDHEFIHGRGTSDAGRAAGSSASLHRGQVGGGRAPQRIAGLQRRLTGPR